LCCLQRPWKSLGALDYAFTLTGLAYASQAMNLFHYTNRQTNEWHTLAFRFFQWLKEL